MNKRVLIVGSDKASGGGVSSVIRLIEKMPVWEIFNCYWLGTQIQRNYLWKLWYALKAYVIAIFIIWRYDIVHFHTVQDKISLLIQLPIILLAKLGRKKVIVQLHIGNQLLDCGGNGFLIWWLEKSNGIVLLAKKFKTLFGDIFPDIKTPTYVIYNACGDVEAIPYVQHKKTILFACAFTENKSGEHLIEAFAKVHAEFPDWKLQLVGSGVKEKKYKELISQYGIEDKVEMPGYLRGDALKKMYQQAGIYCLCSHHEGFPMVVLEAWSYGVPVVTTPVGGLPDVLEESVNALSYTYGNIEELSDKLRTLLNNKKLRMEMSMQSILCARNNFSLTAVNESLEELYRNI